MSKATINIQYEYSPVGLCTKAKAHLGEVLVGEATQIDLVKGEYIEVEEVHYSFDGDGTSTFKAHVRFGIPGGLRLQETATMGRRPLDIFREWPI